jgi:Glycoside-hydrolase family GH114
MNARLSMCAAKRFDAVEFDNVDGYLNHTGFPLTAHQQLRYDVFLANTAHARGPSALLKNDLDQVGRLMPYFDGAQRTMLPVPRMRQAVGLRPGGQARARRGVQAGPGDVLSEGERPEVQLLEEAAEARRLAAPVSGRLTAGDRRVTPPPT